MHCGLQDILEAVIYLPKVLDIVSLPECSCALLPIRRFGTIQRNRIDPMGSIVLCLPSPIDRIGSNVVLWDPETLQRGVPRGFEGQPLGPRV